MTLDRSRGWNDLAQEFIAVRSDAGVATVRRWAAQLPPGGAVVDIGCGAGAPISAALVDEGFEVFGVDASPALLAEFRRRFPSAETACEAAESSSLFHRQFDGAVALGLLFLLPADDQRQVIDRAARALKPGGRFLFTAPRRPCEWTDVLTGRLSLSLGEDAYRQALEHAGLSLAGHDTDEGENDYFDAVLTAV